MAQFMTRARRFATLPLPPPLPFAAKFLRRVTPQSAAPYLRLSPRVLSAALNGEPIVALESTIISHGMPYPRNVETALAVEAAVSRGGATPATIAILGGRVHVGLAPEELEALARAGPTARKTSRRDFAAVLAGGGMGATTVSGTMIAAHLARIAVFATGGVGGVHRGGEASLDVSADLTELGRTPVCVVCSGVKSILDIGRTLERLETEGVPVLVFRADEMPAFYSPASGHAAPARVDTTGAIARQLLTSARLGLRNGTLVAVPCPEPARDVEAAIARALEEARAKGVAGGDVTPFLLARVAELSGGASLDANVALVTHNAGVAARIACDLVRIEREDGGVAGLRRMSVAARRASAGVGVSVAVGAGVGGGGGASAVAAAAGAIASAASAGASTAAIATASVGSVGARLGGGARSVAARTSAATPRSPATRTSSTKRAFSTLVAATHCHANGVRASGPIVVVGGAVLDTLCRPSPETPLVRGSSNPGTVRQSAGGVGRNIAEAVARLWGSGGGGTGADPRDVVLVTALGDDPAGAALAASCSDAGVRIVRAGGSASAPLHTASYCAMLDGEGELIAAVADTAAFGALTPAALGLSGAGGSAAEPVALLGAARLVVVDANLGASTLRAVAAALCPPPSALHPTPRAPTPLVFEPISVAKCVRAVDAGTLLPAAALVKPSALEVVALAAAWRTRMRLPPLPSPGVGIAGADGGAEGDAEGGAAGDAAGGDDVPTNDSLPLDSRTLLAAQTVLAAMLRPTSGAEEPIGAAALRRAWAHSDGAGAAPATDPEGVAEAVAAAAAAAAASVRSGCAATPASGSLLDGRKHVVVSLGAGGVLWLSCPPVADLAAADAAATLPFFAAAVDARVGFDFRLLPPPPVRDLAKVTGAGDTLLGAAVWALAVRGAPVAEALRWGLAGAQAALETPGPAVPRSLSAQGLAERRDAHVAPVDAEYS